uniref:Alternative protein EZH2 n=1 Tax=Homo sapiens TaxID=9606 RepID=L0R855_HUMAN|nr:alternative protein EZH2 [Homo sapiens]
MPLVNIMMMTMMMMETILKKEKKSRKIWRITEMIKKAAHLGNFLLIKFLKPFPQCFQIRAQQKN